LEKVKSWILSSNFEENSEINVGKITKEASQKVKMRRYTNLFSRKK